LRYINRRLYNYSNYVKEFAVVGKTMNVIPHNRVMRRQFHN